MQKWFMGSLSSLVEITDGLRWLRLLPALGWAYSFLSPSLQTIKGSIVVWRASLSLSLSPIGVAHLLKSQSCDENDNA
jgi:hypothetical protein